MISTVWDGIIIGGAGGAIAGLTVALTRYIHTKTVECIEKRRVYAWLGANASKEYYSN